MTGNSVEIDGELMLTKAGLLLFGKADAAFNSMGTKTYLTLKTVSPVYSEFV